MTTADLTQPLPQQPSLVNVLTPFLVGVCMAVFLAPLSIQMAALVYALSFLVLMWQRHDLGLMVMLGVSFSQHELPLGVPVNISLGEANLALCLLVLALKASAGQVTFRTSPVLWPVLWYLLVCLVSSMITWRGGTAITSIAQMMVYLIVAVIVGASIIDYGRQAKPALYALALGAVPVAVALMVSDTTYVLGLHKNGAGAGLAMGLIIATELLLLSWDDPRRRRWLLAVCMIIGVGLVFSLSRGAWLSAIVGIGIVLMMRRQYALAFRVVLMVLPLLLGAWLLLPAEDREYALSVDPERRNIAHRHDTIEYAWGQFTDQPILGVGVGLRKEFDSTNIALSTLAETGVIGLATFLLLHFSVFRLMRRGIRYIPRHDPWFSVLVLAGALVAARFTHGLVDHYWSRGMLLVAWTMVGVASVAVSRAAEEASSQPEPTA